MWVGRRKKRKGGSGGNEREREREKRMKNARERSMSHYQEGGGEWDPPRGFSEGRQKIRR